MAIEYEWRGAFDDREVSALHAEGFEHELTIDDWRGQVERHSLGWVCARRDGRAGRLRQRPLGRRHPRVHHGHAGHRETAAGWASAAELVAVAEREARAAGCQWLHVDFEDHLRPFYFDACGFTPTNAGLIEL